MEHQTQMYFKRTSPHVIPSLTLHLPAGIRNPYYYDQIGNVSTSRLRIIPSVPKGAQGTKYSLLELKPRYPIMGGWNYSFTLGWDSPLRDWASYGRDGRYTVAVPLQTQFPDTVVENAEIQIILPEGAA